MTSIQEIYEHDPLLRFSIYSAVQARTVRRLGQDLLSHLDRSLAVPGQIEGPHEEFYGNLWLWVLAAYEVVRTMAQARHCFSRDAHARILAYKRTLATLRIPFAKQEFAGSREVISGEASIYGFDFARRDVQFQVRGVALSVRDLITQFDDLIGSLTISDILADLRDGATSAQL